MESINTFNGGMSSDLSKFFQSKDKYLKAINFRPLTELGQSSGALVNIKGNECQIGFPSLQRVFKFTLIKHTTGSSSFRITINGIQSDVIVVNNSTTTQDVYNIIKSMPNCYESTNNTPFPYSNFAVAYHDDVIVIYQTPEYKNCSNGSTTVSVTVSTVSYDGHNYFQFFTDNGGVQNNPATPGYYINSIPNNLVIIGSTYINDSFYVFTCPSNNFTNVGQIWEMFYNVTNNETSLKLLYNGYLSFNKDYPIPPSAALGRYEIPTIQRIYWTDFNNPVRSCNVKDPNLMAYPVDLFNLKPSVNYNVPILHNIVQGAAVNNLNSGDAIQCAYRLVKNNGAITNYSALSNIVYTNEYTITDQQNANRLYCAMQGVLASGTVNKAYEWKISGIDTNFDIIEFVIIIRDGTTENYSIYKFDEQIIGGQESVITRFNNNTDTMEQLTIDEFLLDTIFFNKCKTIETKDNRLFFGNIKSDVLDVLDTYDTRAFRFRPLSSGFGNQTGVKVSETDNSITTFTINNIVDYAQIDENKDNLCPYNLGFDTNDDPLMNGDYRFQYNSNVIGGTGPNISYTFGSILLRADKQVQEPFNATSVLTNSGTNRDVVGTQNYYDGYRIPGVTDPTWYWLTNLEPTNLGTLYHEYFQRRTKQTLGGDFFGGLFKSYQLQEIYRFAIVFKDKFGQAFFAKWIGDIKFPAYGDTNVNGGKTSAGNQVTDFRSMYVDSTGAYLNIPYISFTVNIPQNVAEVISSYEIVRCKRDENDRVVNGHGLLTQISTGFRQDNGWGVSPTDRIHGYLPIPTTSSNMPGGTPHLNPNTFVTNPASACEARTNMAAFHCFNYLARPEYNPYNEGDRIYATERYQSSRNAAVSPTGAFLGDINMYYISKFYQLNAFIFGGAYNVSDMQYVPLGGISNPIANTTAVYHNYNIDTIPSGYNVNRSQSLGSPCTVVGVNQVGGYPLIDWTNTLGSAQNDTKVLAIHVKPSRLRSQYGGRGYLQRANSEYISTGTFQTITEAGIKSFICFGGDTYHGVLDVQKAVKNWGQSGRTQTADKCSRTWFFPTQSIFNIDLRVGIHVNADLNNDNGTSDNSSGNEEYTYYKCFSFENELKKYYPKPIFFNQTNEWNNRVYYSEVKINGENNDSWTAILPNNFYDVEGNYGPINGLSILGNNMYYVQDRAFGILNINPVSMITDGNNLPIMLGRGDVVQKHMNISTDYGTKHQWSLTRSQNAILFVDINKRKVLLFNGSSLTPISDLKENRNYFIKKLDGLSIKTNDNPIIGKGILSTYDFYNDEFLITTLDTRQEVIMVGEEPLDREVRDYSTIAYSGLTNNFTSLYSFTPNIYINNTTNIYSTNTFNNTKLYLHNKGNYCQFYGTTYNSYIQLIINDNPLKTKVFDNLVWNTEAVTDNLIRLDEYTNIDIYGNPSDNINRLNNTFKKLRCYNDYQNTDWITLLDTGVNKNIRRTEQGWNVYVPRNKFNYDTNLPSTYSIFDSSRLTKTSWGERLRDKYMVTELEYDNSLNYRFVVHNLSTVYRISDR